MEIPDTTNAISTLERLLELAEFNQNKTYSEVNLMYLYSGSGDMEKALKSARSVSANEKVSAREKSKAMLIIAREAIDRGDIEEAKLTYDILKKTATGEIMAETMYYEAYFLNKEEQYEKSNTVIFDIASTYSMYKYWGAKSLIIMARNFDSLDDQYQAVYTLETVIKNFDFEETDKIANDLLKEINSKSITESDTTNTEASVE